MQEVHVTSGGYEAEFGQATGGVINVITKSDSNASKGSAFACARPHSLESRQRYAAAFAEDEWRIGNSLTIRPGVRFEQETLSGSIVQDFSLKNNWAPRVGIVWDPSGSGRSKVFANSGRYYARVPNDLAARALSSDALITADCFDPNLTQPVPDGTVTTNATTGAATTTHFTLLGGNADDIDPNAKLSYYNEWVAGTEYTLSSGLALGVRYVHRDIGRVLGDVQPYPILAISLRLPGATTANYLLTNPGPNTPVIQDIPGATVGFESPVHN